MVESQCLIEACILSLNCSNVEFDYQPCRCERDLVVRYNVTDEQDDTIIAHYGIIAEQSSHDERVIRVRTCTYSETERRHDRACVSMFAFQIGEIYPCFYDERDVTTIFWTQPDQQTYYILLSMSLVFVFAIILVPIVYFMVIIEFTDSKTNKNKNKNSKKDKSNIN
jgi:hypothetical protein